MWYWNSSRFSKQNRRKSFHFTSYSKLLQQRLSYSWLSAFYNSERYERLCFWLVRWSVQKEFQSELRKECQSAVEFHIPLLQCGGTVPCGRVHALLSFHTYRRGWDRKRVLGFHLHLQATVAYYYSLCSSPSFLPSSAGKHPNPMDTEGSTSCVSVHHKDKGSV